MPERPLTPPQQKMVREFSLPDHTAGFFVEVVSKESARYQNAYPIKRGTLYSTVQGGDVRTSDSFAPLYFLKETRYGTSDTLVSWIWATDQNSQDASNSDVTYSGESTSHPVYARVYHIRRSVYETTPALTIGTALTALIAIKVTAAGTGYAATDTVNISGGGGATAELVVNSAGAIQSVIVTNGGSGYDSASLPTVTVTSSTGSSATLVAVVQTKTAVLVSQRKQELGHDSPFTSQSTDSPYSSTYVRVIRIWEVLPGPWLEAAPEVDKETLSVITRKRRRNIGANITPSAALSGGNTLLSITTKEEIDAYMAWEVVTEIPLPAARSEGTAVTSTEFRAQEFPGRIDLALLDAYGTALGYKKPFAQIVPATIKTYWAFSDTQPSVTYESIIPDTVVINGVTYHNVLHDFAVRYYELLSTGINIPIALAATTPSYTTYITSWVGQLKLIDGSVVPEKWQKMWKVTLIYIRMM